VMAKTAPYWLATGTHSLLATGTINRMAAPVTFTPATAVPLAVSGFLFSKLNRRICIRKICLSITLRYHKFDN
jgi:hypothetical protein